MTPGDYAILPVLWTKGLIFENCGQVAPTFPIKFEKNTGLIVFRLKETLAGNLCWPCIQAAYKSSQAHNLLLGWWGIVSFFATLIYLGDNSATFRQAKAHFLRSGRLGMQCPNCGQVKAPEQQFCTNCGVPSSDAPVFRRRKGKKQKCDTLRKQLQSIDLQEAVWRAIEEAGLDPTECTGEAALHFSYTLLVRHDRNHPFVRWYRSADSEELEMFLRGWDQQVRFHNTPHPDDPLRKLSMADKRVEVVNRTWLELKRRKISPMFISAASSLRFVRALARTDPRSITADWLKAADQDEQVKFLHDWEDHRRKRVQQEDSEDDRFAELAALYHSARSGNQKNPRELRARMNQLEREVGKDEAITARQWASMFTRAIE